MFKKEGPTNIPEHTVTIKAIRTCSGCRYYSHEMWRSGKDPIHKDRCYHPSISDRVVGNNLLPSPNYEDHYVHTPDWCPFLK